MTLTSIPFSLVSVRGVHRSKRVSLVLALTASACANEAEHALSPSVALSQAEAAGPEPKPASPTPTEISAPRILGQAKVVRSAELPHVPNELSGIEH